jgi:predicted nucleic acid-binding Zn ribbon protein
MDNFIKSKDAIGILLKKLGLTKEKLEIYLYWEKIVGENLVKKIQVVGIKNDTLLLKVNSSAYRHQVKLYQKEWLKKINTYLGENLIQHLKVVK